MSPLDSSLCGRLVASQVLPLCRGLIRLFASLALLGFAAESLSAEPRRLIMGYCGTSLQAADMEAPIGVDGLVRQSIEPLHGTLVDTVYWQLNTDPYYGSASHHLTDWFSHDTQVGPRWGEGRASFKTAGEWRIYENARQIMATGTDPVRVVIEHGHRAGLDVFLSLRFNDGHDHRLPGGLDDPNMSPMKRKHPEWLLGPTVGDYSRFAYNFALPEVRRYRMDLVAETIAKYDLDGFDYDFCRWPILFRPGEGVTGAAVITELLRETRDLLQRKSATVGRPLALSVRVPYELAESKAEGMDTAAWIKEGIVDVVIVAGRGGSWNFRLPIEQYTSLAAGTSCQIIAQNLDGRKWRRPRSAMVLFDEPDYHTTEMHRAVAALHWRAGANGIYIWTQDWMKFVMDGQFNPQWWKEVGSPNLLSRLDKHYIVGPAGRGGNLPLRLAQPGDLAEVNVETADDLRAATERSPRSSATLRLMVEQLTVRDRITYEFNGTKLDPTTALRRYNYNDCWLDFDVSHLLRPGANSLKLRVEARNPRVGAPLLLRCVDALVHYDTR